MAFGSGVQIGSKVYVAGGLNAPDSPEPLNSFWVLDLAVPEKSWQELPSWPGAPRMLSVAATKEGELFLISGDNLVADTARNQVREFLTDAYKSERDTGGRMDNERYHRAAVGAQQSTVKRDQAHLQIFG